MAEQYENAEIMFYGIPIVSIDFPNLELIKDCGFIKGCNSLTSVNLPKLKTLDKVRFLSECIYNHRTTKTNQKYPSVNL